MVRHLRSGRAGPPGALGTLAGVAASMVVGTVTAAGLVVPRARRFYLEERIASASFGQMIHAVFVRIPFGTALPEELLFRGVVLGMLTRQRSSVRATIVSSLAFGLWHVLPALERIETNPGTSHHSGNSLRTAAVVAAHVATTTAAGVGFSWLRLRSGSVIAPAIAHAAPNGAGFLAGWALARLTRHRQRDQAPSETPSDRPVPGNDGPAIHPGERPLGVRSGHPSAVNS